MEQKSKKLYRSRDDRFIAGVCGGLGEYFNISPALFRVLAVFLVLANGFGGLAYIVCWIVIPEEPGEKEAEKTEKKPKEAKAQTDHSLVWAVILIAFGIFFLIHNFYPAMNIWRLWPLALVAVGIQMLISNYRDN